MFTKKKFANLWSSSQLGSIQGGHLNLSNDSKKSFGPNIALFLPIALPMIWQNQLCKEFFESNIYGMTIFFTHRPKHFLHKIMDVHYLQYHLITEKVFHLWLVTAHAEPDYFNMVTYHTWGPPFSFLLLFLIDKKYPVFLIYFQPTKSSQYLKIPSCRIYLPKEHMSGKFTCFCFQNCWCWFIGRAFVPST